LERHEMVREYLQALNLIEPKPDLEFLNELNRRHVATFAFSSVGCRLGEDLPLDFASLFDRIVVRRRGGYCFEQNGLMFEVLEELGFKVELYLARVIYNEDTHPGLTHRVNLIELDGQRFILDVGFGPQGPRVLVGMSGQETKDGEVEQARDEWWGGRQSSSSPTSQSRATQE
jgi:N-hydroxyarylamine O-acetyltransferase